MRFHALTKLDKRRGGSRQAKVGKEQVVGDDVLAVGQSDVVQEMPWSFLWGSRSERAFSGLNLRDF